MDSDSLRDGAMQELLDSPTWHIFYPQHPNEFCFVASEHAWSEHGRPARWSQGLESVCQHIVLALHALGHDVYAEDCPLKPWTLKGNPHALLEPEQDKLAKLARDLGKTIVLYRLEHALAQGHTIKRLYAVVPRITTSRSETSS